MAECHQSAICDDYLPAMRAALDRIERAHVARPQALHGHDCDVPVTCGPVWWSTLHAAAEAISCVHCQPDGVQLINAIHDLKNVELGKPLQRADDFRAVARRFVEAAKSGESHTPPAKHKEHVMSAAQWDVNRVNAYAREVLAHAPHDREIGFSVCKFSGPGPTAVGSHDHVRIPIVCNGSDPIVAAFHTHPDGLPTPSPADYANAARQGVPTILIGQPQLNTVRDFRVQGGV